MIKAQYSSSSAFNLELALQESQKWIEEVIGQAFPTNFQDSLKDGVFLCKLINTIKPGCVGKINNANTEFAKRENLQFFVKASKSLGLKDTQLFESNDLYENHRVRNVTITLYWLGRAARAVNTYKGPQLNLLAFQAMNCSACKKAITDNNYLATISTQYHTSCAKCCSCSKKLDPKKKFYQEGNNMWCEDCMIGATNISGNKANVGNGGKNNGTKNDNECSNCYGSLEKGYVPGDHDPSKKYCTQCICDLCHAPLVGNFQIKDNKKICSDCSCVSCGKGLQDGYFEEGISRYCEPCANNRKKQSAPQQKQADHHQHQHGDGCKHDHSDKSNSPKQHQHPTTTSTTSPSSQNKNDNCKACNKSLNDKTKKHGDDRDKFCTPHEDACCHKCNKEINGPALQALNANWHPDCFGNCEKCNRKLKPGESFKKSTKGNPVCEPCSNSSISKCKECKKDIIGDGVETDSNSKYHPNCFKCHSCDKQLKDSYQEIDNDPYCDPCANQLNKLSPSSQSQSPFITSGWGPNDVCDGCKKSLNGEVAKTGPKTYYHRGCFKCQGVNCGQALHSGYYPNANKPYCKSCSDKMNESGKCGKCNKPVVDGEIIKTGSGVLFHKACFTCTTCSKPIGNGTALTRFSKPYCQPCYAKEKLICAKCRNQIQGEVVTCDHKEYCVKCAPAPTNQVLHGERISAGWTIDKRSGKKTFN